MEFDHEIYREIDLFDFTSFFGLDFFLIFWPTVMTRASFFCNPSCNKSLTFVFNILNIYSSYYSMTSLLSLVTKSAPRLRSEATVLLLRLLMVSSPVLSLRCPVTAPRCCSTPEASGPPNDGQQQTTDGRDTN